jgi:hypothetical protein
MHSRQKLLGSQHHRKFVFHLSALDLFLNDGGEIFAKLASGAEEEET